LLRLAPAATASGNLSRAIQGNIQRKIQGKIQGKIERKIEGKIHENAAGIARRSGAVALLSPGLARRFPFSAPLWTRDGVSFRFRGRAKWGDCHMMIKASGRSALILATGLFVCFAGPSPTMAASADSTATILKSDGATAVKSAKQSSRHWKRTASSKSGNVASKSDETRKADVADAASDTSAAIPASVANANAQLTPADAPADSANAMSAKASTMLVAATDKPAEAQPATDTQVVSSDQLNDVDRALQQNPTTPQQPPSTQTVAMASAKAAPAAPALASGDSSTWDQTSLIGKIFIAFGALLTMASAARMFMA
jgi:hypothetical protein